MFNFTIRLNAFLLAITVLCFSCKKDDEGDLIRPEDQTPTTYNFSNVNYSGQVVRLLLLMDLEAKMQEATTNVVAGEELRKLFDSTNTYLNKYTSISTNKGLAQSFYMSSSASSLRAAMLDSVRNWLDTIAARSGNANALVRQDGVDLSQAVAKTIMGGVFYDQAVNKYLVKVATDDNDKVTEGNGTTMEHSFDEAFGYFGAARDYNSYTDDQIKSGAHIDSDGDGIKDTLSEMNFRYFAATAAKRELGGSNYTKELFDAFLTGRYSISNKKYAERDAAIATIKSKWEEIIAATVIHYINDTKADIESSNANLSKHWSELRFYFNMLPLYSANKLGLTSIGTINNLIGLSPSATTPEKLAEAADIIQDAYGFSDDQKNNWRK